MGVSGRRTQLVLLLTVFGAAMCCGGCAFGHREVALNYTPTATASSEGNGTAVYLAPIQDVCPNPEVTAFAKGREIGDIRNDYYMKTACVVSKSMDLSPWVTDALTKELRQRGFQPVQVTSLPPECPLGVSGSLSECYSKMKFLSGQTCTLKANISISKNGAPVSNRQYVGVHEGGLGLGTAEEYEKIFQAAMSDLMAKVVTDIVANAQ